MKNSHKSVPFSLPTSVNKSLRKLIREVKELELEAGRSLAFEELRVLPLPPTMIDHILRQVSEQRSTEGVVACLESFAESFSPMLLHRLKGRFASVRRYLAALCSQLRLHPPHND